MRSPAREGDGSRRQVVVVLVVVGVRGGGVGGQMSKIDIFESNLHKNATLKPKIDTRTSDSAQKGIFQASDRKILTKKFI